jgi:hypothetical protein
MQSLHNTNIIITTNIVKIKGNYILIILVVLLIFELLKTLSVLDEDEKNFQ